MNRAATLLAAVAGLPPSAIRQTSSVRRRTAGCKAPSDRTPPRSIVWADDFSMLTPAQQQTKARICRRRHHGPVRYESFTLSDQDPAYGSKAAS
jgi:hypothetical protein